MFGLGKKKQDLSAYATELKTFAPKYEYSVIKILSPIANPDWNFLQPKGSGHRTLNELASLGWRINSIILDRAGYYIYYLEREYRENDGINRSLPSDYDHSRNDDYGN